MIEFTDYRWINNHNQNHIEKICLSNRKSNMNIYIAAKYEHIICTLETLQFFLILVLIFKSVPQTHLVFLFCCVTLTFLSRNNTFY